MWIANRKSNDFLESPKIIDEQNVLKSTSTTDHQCDNEAGNRFVSIPDFRVAPIAKGLMKFFREMKVSRMVART